MPLKDVRDLRQIPAHEIEENKYDIGLFNNQHDLTVKVFNSLNLLRRLMQTLPKAKNIDIRYKETKKQRTSSYHKYEKIYQLLTRNN